MTWLAARLRDERGIAVITALLVSMVVVMLGITSVTLAVHNSEQSNYDRRRVQAIAAAEAGVNWYFSHFQSVPFATFACSKTQDLPTTPPTRFTAQITLYNSAGTVVACPPTTLPATALIESEGVSTTNVTPTRTVQAYVELSTIGAGAFAGVSLFSDTGLTLPSNVKLFGRTGNDGNIYSNGNITLKGNDVISGDVTAQGTVTMENVAQVKRHVLAGGAISMKSSTQILGNATSSASSITVQGNKLSVVGTAQAGTTITASGSAIPPQNRIAPSPTTFPARTFPVFDYQPTAWITAGWSVTTFTSCAAAKTFIQGLGPGKNVVRIEADCDLAFDGDAPILTGDLAIISDGSLTMGNNTPWGNDGVLHSLYLVFGFDDNVAPCNMTFGSNATIDPGNLVVMHTPCTINMSSSALIMEGQIMGGTVLLRPGTQLTYRPLSIPGMGGGTPAVDLVYTREVVTT
jgi:Tfp pilus assembly protein PilX